MAVTHHGNLGVVASLRGNLARAEVYFRSTLDALSATAPETLDRARATLNLAALIAERGGTGARWWSSRPARRWPRTWPRFGVPHRGPAESRHRRTNVGDEPGGTRAYEEALAIASRSAPDSALMVTLLANLARNAERRGALDAATGFAARATAQAARVAPASIEATLAYHVAGRIAEARADRDEARRLQQRAIDIARTTAPGSRWSSARWRRWRGSTSARTAGVGGGAYAEALEALDRGVSRLGAAVDVEAAFVDRANLQRPYVDVLLALGRREQAFEAVERFRARAVLDRLATRDLRSAAPTRPARWPASAARWRRRTTPRWRRSPGCRRMRRRSRCSSCRCG